MIYFDFFVDFFYPYIIFITSSLEGHRRAVELHAGPTGLSEVGKLSLMMTAGAPTISTRCQGQGPKSKPTAGDDNEEDLEPIEYMAYRRGQAFQFIVVGSVPILHVVVSISEFVYADKTYIAE